MTPRDIIERLVTAVGQVPSIVESRFPYEVFPGEDSPGNIEGFSFSVGVGNTIAAQDRQNRANRGSMFVTEAFVGLAVRIPPGNARSAILDCFDLERDVVQFLHAVDRDGGFVIDIPQIGPRAYDAQRKLWTTRITVRCLTLYPLEA